jgi:hypothetical protein
MFHNKRGRGLALKTSMPTHVMQKHVVDSKRANIHSWNWNWGIGPLDDSPVFCILEDTVRLMVSAAEKQCFG